MKQTILIGVYSLTQLYIRRFTMLPKDPVMLLSYMNMKLRDNYSSLDALCDDLEINNEELAEIIGKLEGIGYKYNSERNQFA